MSASLRDTARSIWSAGLAAADAGRRLEQVVRISGDQLVFADVEIDLRKYRRIVVVGAGKSASAMAAALEAVYEKGKAGSKHWPELTGRVHVVDDDPTRLEQLTIAPSRPRSSNLPTAKTVEETGETIELLKSCEPSDLVLFLITGGASALLEAPRVGVEVAEIQDLAAALFQSGAPIEEVNAVRGRLSAVKHGGLIRLCADCRTISLVLSDVLQGGMEVVGAGPSIVAAEDLPDPMRIIQNRIPNYKLPNSIIGTLTPAQGANTEMADRVETRNEKVTGQHQAVLIGSVETAVAGCVAAARKAGFDVEFETDVRNVKVSDVAKEWVSRRSQMKARARATGRPQCFVSGGEPSVLMDRPAGVGGRNTQFALSFLAELLRHNRLELPSDISGSLFCSVATDGEDGTGDCAGGVIDRHVVEKTVTESMIAELDCALRNFDSYPFLKNIAALIPSFAPRTNVCDLRLLLVRP